MARTKIDMSSGCDLPIGCRWAGFAVGLATMLLFAFAVIPALQSLGPVREVRDAIRRGDIDATALFYTECDSAAEAEASIRNAIRYSTTRSDPRSSFRRCHRRYLCH